VFLREVRIGGGPDTDGLIDRFLAPGNGRAAGGAYGAQLIAFVNTSQSAGTTPVSDADAAWTAFLALPAVKRAEFVGQTLIPAALENNQLRRDDPMFRDYPRAFRALATMYPQDGQGNVEVQFSKIRATQGGSVQVMAPGSICRDASAACTDGSFAASANPAVGNIFTGVPNPPSSIVNDPLKGPSQLGLFGLNNASIDIVAGSNVSVFGNRIVTVGSGNLMGWSSYGNIDAGRGSRAAVSAPAPTITVDSAGNVIVDLGGAVQGSGIRAVTVGSQLAGEVSLYAPQGFIDAGDAGIQGGAVFIAANQVINAENIRVGDGITRAVALGDLGGSVNLGSVSSSASSAASGAAQQAASQAAASASDRANRRNRILVVEFEGFGISASDEEEQIRRRRVQGATPR
jgi:filamentous hemagglutinin